MAEEVILQTMDDVKNIDFMRTTTQKIDDTIGTQADVINNISDNLDVIAEVVISNPDISTTVDLSEVLSIVNDQQEQINDIKENINSINDKLDTILEKI